MTTTPAISSQPNNPNDRKLIPHNSDEVKCLVSEWFEPAGGGVLREKLGRGVRPAFQNPYSIYYKNLRFSLPYLWPDQKFDTLFMTWPLNLHLL